MSRAKLIEKLKAEYPTLKKGVNDEVFELDPKEYNETIERWADVQLAEEAKIAEENARLEQRKAILERLGLTDDEAKILLS